MKYLHWSVSVRLCQYYIAWRTVIGLKDYHWYFCIIRIEICHWYDHFYYYVLYITPNINYPFRKNNVRALESLQSTLEAEVKAKAEAIRIQKKMESDIHELEVALEHSNRANADLQKFVKKVQTEIKEQKSVIENSHRVNTEQRENLTNAERKISTLQLELEESRNLLEQSDRARRRAEDDVVDVNEMVRKLTSDNENLNIFKRKLENDFQTLNVSFICPIFVIMIMLTILAIH